MTSVLTITAGSGPEIAQRFVALLADHLAGALPERGLTLLGRSAPDPRCRLLLVGGPARARLGDVLGVHALLHRGPARSRQARKRWFVEVQMSPAHIEPPPLDLTEVRVRMDRSGGPGGQNVNTRATAVRAIHLPTGLQVRAAGERSQARNRAEALRRLAALHDARSVALRGAADRERWLARRSLTRGGAVSTWVLRRGELHR